MSVFRASSADPRGARKLLPPGIVLAGFVLSRVLYFALGVRFDASPLSWFWQYIDPALLKSDFLRSILYLHSQPPLFNVFLGTVVNLFPGRETAVFAAAFLLCGVALALGLYLLMREAGVCELTAAVLTTLFITSPACALYENWLFYTYPVATALVLSALFWARFSRTRRTRDALGLFSFLALPALTWSLFHLAWLFLSAAALLALSPGARKRILAALAVPLLLVVLWYGKNLLIFGQFTATTWTGLNFSKMTNGMLSAEERWQLAQRGDISGVSLVPPFRYVEDYRQYLELPAPTGIPVLDEPLKQSGVPNFNHKLYIEAGRRSGVDAVRILSLRPRAYLDGLALAWLTFLLPADAYELLLPNRRLIPGIANSSNAVYNGRFRFGINHTLFNSDRAAYFRQSFLNIGFFTLAAYLAAFAFGVALLWRGRWRRHPAGPALLFLWFTVVFASVLGNATEVGENNRFRFALDPLALVLAACLSERARARFARRPPAAAPRRRR